MQYVAQMLPCARSVGLLCWMSKTFAVGANALHMDPMEAGFLRMQALFDAQSAKIDQMQGSIQQLQGDVAEIKRMNAVTQTTSSGSSGRFICPLNCGSDFKKVIFAVFC